MAGETQLVVVGNLTADPDLKFIGSGDAVVNFTIASTPRTFDRESGQWRDGDALFMRCSAWKQLAENISESFTKGTRVIAQGRLKQRSFETREGEKRTVVELEVDEIGGSVRFATSTTHRADRQSSGGGQRQSSGGGRAWGGSGGSGGQQGMQEGSGWGRTRQGGGGGSWGRQGGGGGQSGGDPWAAPTQDDEPPFGHAFPGSRPIRSRPGRVDREPWTVA